MSDWSDGYITDIDYTYGYYPDIAPQTMALPFLANGLMAPEVRTACELGFGQGVTVAINAAASPTTWYGTDFNPAQTIFARELIETGNAHLHDQAFAEFCTRDDLPDFDYIALHGIWTWIDDENRRVIVDFVRRKLRPGGVLFLSYNSQPGWADMVPMRALFGCHAELMSGPGMTSADRMGAALAFAQQVLKLSPTFTRANPYLARRLAALGKQDETYLAHEYLNKNWAPMTFPEVGDWLRAAKLTFAAAANMIVNFDELQFSEEQRQFLESVQNPTLQHFVRDLILNTRFRRDYWVKGVRRLDPVVLRERLRALRVVQVAQAPDNLLALTTARGEIALERRTYEPLVALLADHRPRMVGEIERAPDLNHLSLKHLLQAFAVLNSKGLLQVAQSEVDIDRARPACDRINARILNLARGDALPYLACPVTGSAVGVNRVQMLFLLARLDGRATADEWASYAWRGLQAAGRRLEEDGVPLAPDEALVELNVQARRFADSELPRLQALQVVS